MNKAPTNPAQLARWMRVPRTMQSKADYASPITVYQATHEVSKRIVVGIVLLLMLLGCVHFVAR